jgi:hypothetical protein
MKKLIISSGIILSSIILFVGCQKDQINNEVTTDQVTNELSNKLDISEKEFKYILSELNSQEKAPPGWLQKFKDWVNAHTGNSQQYENGQPVCFGNGGCGPCPGICFGSGIMSGGNDGQVTQEEFVLGIRAIALAIIEKNGNAAQKKMVIEIPSQYDQDIIINNRFEVESDEQLASFYVNAAGYNSITVKAGTYPVITSPKDGVTRTIVNISVN